MYRAFHIIIMAVAIGATRSAPAGESRMLDAVESGSIKTDTEVALPSGNQAPSVGWEKEPAHFFYELNKAEEKNITDKAFPFLPAKWPFDFAAVCWENPIAANEQERKWVRDAVERTWQKHSNLRFSGWESCEPKNLGIRIVIEDSGPHVKVLGKFLNGRKDGMVLNFTFERWSEPCKETPAKRRSCIESIAVHEFGHAIGFAHEQNRPDTPGECAQRRQGTDGDATYITPWDLKSVMNYCNPVYNNNGILSTFDVKAVQYIYGTPK